MKSRMKKLNTQFLNDEIMHASYLHNKILQRNNSDNETIVKRFVPLLLVKF